MDIYLQGMRDRSMLGGTELVREIKVTDWSMARNLSNRSSGVQIPCVICTRLERYLYSAKCSWIINVSMYVDRITRKLFPIVHVNPAWHLIHVHMLHAFKEKTTNHGKLTEELGFKKSLTNSFNSSSLS